MLFEIEGSEQDAKRVKLEEQQQAAQLHHHQVNGVRDRGAGEKMSSAFVPGGSVPETPSTQSSTSASSVPTHLSLPLPQSPSALPSAEPATGAAAAVVAGTKGGEASIEVSMTGMDAANQHQHQQPQRVENAANLNSSTSTTSTPNPNGANNQPEMKLHPIESAVVS